MTEIEDSNQGRFIAPLGPGAMSFSDAAAWIATRSKYLAAFPNARDVWLPAIRALVDEIIDGKVEVTGRLRDKLLPETILPNQFVGLKIIPPLQQSFEDITSNVLRLEVRVWCRDDEPGDTIQIHNQTYVVTHLHVRKSDVAAIWPLDGTDAKEEMLQSIAGKQPAVIKWLEHEYPEGVPNRSEAPLQRITAKLLAEHPHLAPMDPKTLRRAINAHNSLVEKRKKGNVGIPHTSA